MTALALWFALAQLRRSLVDVGVDAGVEGARCGGEEARSSGPVVTLQGAMQR